MLWSSRSLDVTSELIAVFESPGSTTVFSPTRTVTRCGVSLYVHARADGGTKFAPRPCYTILAFLLRLQVTRMQRVAPGCGTLPRARARACFVDNPLASYCFAAILPTQLRNIAHPMDRPAQPARPTHACDRAHQVYCIYPHAPRLVWPTRPSLVRPKQVWVAATRDRSTRH